MNNAERLKALNDIAEAVSMRDRGVAPPGKAIKVAIALLFAFIGFVIFETAIGLVGCGAIGFILSLLITKNTSWQNQIESYIKNYESLDRVSHEQLLSSKGISDIAKIREWINIENTRIYAETD